MCKQLHMLSSLQSSALPLPAIPHSLSWME